MAPASLFFRIALVIYYCCLLNYCGCVFLQGYYWREYGGVAPDDALAGGTDRNGKPIYIGQILHDNKLIPTKIYENSPVGYYGFLGKEFNRTQYQKILCSETPDNFKWIPTRVLEMNYLTNLEIVVGGYEPGCTTYIGRALHNSETLVGKVTECGIYNYGLFVTSNGSEVSYRAFEILTYNSESTTLAVG